THVPRPHIDSDVAQKTEVALMSREPVVAVVAVLDQQLPVGPCTVGLLPGDHLHSYFGLVGDQVQVFARSGQVVVEALRRGIETREHETAIALDPGGRSESALLARKRIAVGVLAWYPHQLAARIVGPRVIRTLKGLGVARLLAADHRAAVGAGVKQ